MKKHHQLGIFEAGISLQNEMQALENIIKPDIGIFTNIGSAHNEGFRSLKQKITEKLRLFKNSKVLIYCKDYKEVSEELEIFLRAVNPGIKLIGWSQKSLTDLTVEIKVVDNGSILTVHFVGEEYSFQLPFSDNASIENAIHCAYLGLYLHFYGGKTFNLEKFFSRFSNLRPVAMRLELKQGINNNYIIDDSYNNDLGGLRMALNFMSQHHAQRKKVLIISDFLQSGLNDHDLYSQFSDLVKSQNIHLLIGIGNKISSNKNLFFSISEEKPQFFETTQDFVELFDFSNLQNSLVLVKGARPFAFERIVNKMIMKVHGTVFEINLDALTHNLNFYRAKIGSETKIMVMVKAFAYGSGSMEVANWLQYHRVDYLSVAYPDEGVVLRQNGIKLPIMVLNSDPDTFHKLFEYDLEPEMYSLRILSSYLNFKRKIYPDYRAKIHLKFDTGMHRLGFLEEDIPELIKFLSEIDHIEVASVFSHLVGSDDPEHNDFSKYQIERFKLMSEDVISKLGYKPLRHISNTAAIVRLPEAKFDMVRLGIGLYGVESSGLEQSSLENVGTLKTTISQIKELKPGQTIGYGRYGKVSEPSRIATIAIGYADGYDRGFSRGIGKVNVNGILCPVIGNVCMDMTMIDVTHAPCKEGDQVIVFGQNPDINTLAKLINTIPYEILTGVSERVKRVFFHG
jgi:alanine racemase